MKTQNIKKNGFFSGGAAGRNYFSLVFPEKMGSDETIILKEVWEDDGKAEEKERAKISRGKWEKIEHEIKAEFNRRIKKNGGERARAGRLRKRGDLLFSRDFGKELCLLMWALENEEDGGVKTQLKNWKGLVAEERWWLFMMTTAKAGGIHDSEKGWRKAIRNIMAEA